MLTDLSLHCPAGKTTALVGFSGSGNGFWGRGGVGVGVEGGGLIQAFGV